MCSASSLLATWFLTPALDGARLRKFAAVARAWERKQKEPEKCQDAHDHYRQPLHHHHMALAFAHPRQQSPLYNAWIKPSVSLCADIQFYEWSDTEGFTQAFNKYKLTFRLSVRSHKASQHIDYNLLDLLRFFHPLRKTKPCLHNV